MPSTNDCGPNSTPRHDAAPSGKDAAPMAAGPAWFRAFARRFPLPDRYLVFDVETTGADARYDVITQVGYLLVEGGAVACELGAVLDWTADRRYDPAAIAARLDAIRARIEWDEAGRPTGRTLPMTVARMRAEGVPPGPVLAAVRDLFADCAAGGVGFVAHCGYMLDQRMLEAAFAGGRPFRFRADHLYDTGAMEKGSQTGDLPRPAESLDAFSRRVLYSRRDGAGRVKFNLADHAFRKYDLGRYGLDPAAAHDALVDCRMTYRLFETFRALSEGRRPE